MHLWPNLIEFANQNACLVGHKSRLLPWHCHLKSAFTNTENEYTPHFGRQICTVFQCGSQKHFLPANADTVARSESNWLANAAMHVVIATKILFPPPPPPPPPPAPHPAFHPPPPPPPRPRPHDPPAPHPAQPAPHTPPHPAPHPTPHPHPTPPPPHTPHPTPRYVAHAVYITILHGNRKTHNDR